jgi:phage-related protein
MIYFTIPVGVISPISTDIYLDDGIQIQTKPSLREVSFGEDYSLTIPLGSRKRTFSGSMSNRSQYEADLIDNYFSYLEGQPIGNFHILGETVTVVALQWSKSFRAVDTYNVQATFKEVIR